VGGRSVFLFTGQQTRECRTADHSSLAISKGEWIWNHGVIGDRSTLDFLVKVRDMKFNDTVETV
jgi:hypothetical protein